MYAMNIRRTALTMFATSALLLTGCANDLQGDVVSKDYAPEYYYNTFIPITTTTCSGSPSVCTTSQTGVMPIINYVPACYSIKVEGKESGSTCISEAEWDKLEPGMYYEGPDVDPKDREKTVDKGEEETK